MEYTTISENFSAQIGEAERVVAALFTTYTFEPDFFEREVIPLMLDPNLGWSVDPTVKRVLVRDALSNTRLPIEVFYDQDLFQSEGTDSPAMEYLHHGIRGDHGAFHAKLTMLLLEDEETGNRTLCVGAGSANLTNAGWWDNVECQHWEKIGHKTHSRKFLNRLRDDLNWLLACRVLAGSVADDDEQALPIIREFAESCSASTSVPVVTYYGIAGVNSYRQKSRPAVINFLRYAWDEHESPYQSWNLEIISPYFADSADFDAHKHFFDDLGVHHIRIYLPFNDQDEPLCRQEYYEKLRADERIEWAKWSPELASKLSLAGNFHRFTHAKIYHFYNGKQSWVFVGSVNFTRKATNDNQEAGFFVRLPYRMQLLVPLEQEPERWCAEDELVSLDKEPAEDAPIPQLRICYDWKADELSVASAEPVVLDLLSAENRLLAEGVKTGQKSVHVDCDTEEIEKELKGGGLLKVSGLYKKGQQPFREHHVLVQQVNWTHKPLNLPSLTPQQIMAIYAGFSQQRRNQVIEYLKERQLREAGLAGESISRSEHRDQGQEFFAEYAELFHAFRNLQKLLDQALEKEEFNRLDYYLSGTGVDSLPALKDSLLDEAQGLDDVTRYLGLLCLVQIYNQPVFKGRDKVAGLLESCEQALSAMESSGEFKLIDDDPERSRRFFIWYRKQFFREYRPVEDEEAGHEAS